MVDIEGLLAALPLGLLLFCFFLIIFDGSQKNYILRSPNNTQFTIRSVQSLLSKKVGLLNHSRLEEHSGLLLKNTRAVHTKGMAFSIDIVFLSKNFRVLEIATEVKPNCIRRGPKGTRHTLELSSGACAKANLECGSALFLEEAT